MSSDLAHATSTSVETGVDRQMKSSVLSARAARRVWLLAGWTSFGIAAAFAVAHLSPVEWQRTLFDNVHWTIAHLGAALMAWVAWRDRKDVDCDALHWVVIGLLVYGVGQIIWDAQAVFGWDTFPAPSDLFYPAQGVLVAWGLWRALGRRVTPARRRVLRLDVLILLIQTLVLVFLTYLPQAPDATRPQLLTLIIYPAVMLGAVVVGLVFALEVGLRLHWHWLLLLMGLSIKACAWMQWNMIDILNAPTSGAWLNLAFSVSSPFCGLGAAYWQIEPHRRAGRLTDGKAFNMLIPIVPVIVAIASLFLIWEGTAVPRVVRLMVVIGSALVVVLTVVRQSFGLAERERLLRAERKLLEHEQQYRAMGQRLELTIAAARMGTWEVDLPRRKATWDRRMFELYGHAPDCGLEPFYIWDHYVDTDEMAVMFQTVQDATPTQPLLERQFRVTTPAGEIRYLETYGLVSFDAAGNRQHMTGVTWDVTEKVKASQALTQSEAELRAIFDNEAVGIVLLDDKRNLVRFNPMVRNWLGVNMNNPARLNGDDLIHPDDRVMSAERFAELESGKRALIQSERRYQHQSGGYRWARTTVYPVQLHGQRFFVGLIEDIEERKQMQMALEKAQAQERQLRAEFTYSLFNVQEQERQRIANELHDSLGQSLSVIRNRAQLALEKLPADGALQSQMTAIIRVTADAIGETRRLAHNLRPLHIEQLGLTVAITQLIAEFEQSTHVHTAQRVENIDDAFRPAQVTHVYRLVQEALNNVSKHARATQVNVLIERDVCEVRLVIQDNGQGFDPVLMRSAGLGVSSMHERTHMLGGRVHITSGQSALGQSAMAGQEQSGIQGQGTTVTIVLPIAELEQHDQIWSM